MATYLFTSEATDLQTGERGTLTLADHLGGPSAGLGPLRPAGSVPAAASGGSASAAGRRVLLRDVESVEITASRAGCDHGATQEVSLVTLHLRDGNAATYSLRCSNPILVSKVFAEAGWIGRRRAARLAALAA